MTRPSPAIARNDKQPSEGRIVPLADGRVGQRHNSPITCGIIGLTERSATQTVDQLPQGEQIRDPERAPASGHHHEHVGLNRIGPNPRATSTADRHGPGKRPDQPTKCGERSGTRTPARTTDETGGSPEQSDAHQRNQAQSTTRNNAVAESFFATIKTELLHRQAWPT